jgi:hypothetical protein
MMKSMSSWHINAMHVRDWQQPAASSQQPAASSHFQPLEERLKNQHF